MTAAVRRAPGAPEVPGRDTWRAWGLEPRWSRLVAVPAGPGDGDHVWHVLDTGEPAGGAAATILCVHGNPTWGYAWKSLLTGLSDRHRVVAVDQLGMGFSERTGPRRYAERVADLDRVITALDLPDGFVLAAHDWGGAIAMGWAVDHVDRVRGMVLCNTGIAVPAGRAAPGIIRLAASAPLRDLVCRRTPVFVEGTVRLSRGRLDGPDRRAFRAPYRRVEHRRAIADFVGDIPLSSPHPSEAALARVADRLGEITAPVLLAWGAADPVFDDDFAADLASRLPHAVRHRFARANHLVMAEADVAGTVGDWLADVVGSSGIRSAPGSAPTDRSAAGADGSGPDGASTGAVERRPVWHDLVARRDDAETAFHDGATGASVTFSELADRVEAVAAALRARGVRPGDHVAMVTPPGIGLVVAVYGVWRAGGVTVIADRGLGLGGLGRARRRARPRWVIGPRPALVAARVLRWAPGAARLDVDELLAAPPVRSADELPLRPGEDDPAAVLFTSGATGPAKGVRYRHRQLEAQRDVLRRTYRIGADDRLVAAFAPFALYGPALGIPTALPDCDVTRPATLTAEALDAACRAVDATMAFASPAALANVVATADDAPGTWPGLRSLRLVMSAGAPVPSEILAAVAERAPGAELHTPYGMTEALPVADVSLAEIRAAEDVRSGAGVCVGTPVEGAEVRIVELGFDPLADGVPPAVPAGTTGEILVRAPWVSEGYLGLWRTERGARPGGGWHRSGDVGHVDGAGRLWVEGRAVHVIDHVDGPITSVPIERRVERALTGRVRRSAAVGVGPAGCQQLVVVAEIDGVEPGLAADDLAAEVRRTVDVPVAAVLVVPALPVDIRHNAKIDRAAVARWADAVLAGRRPPRGGWRP